MLLALVAVVAAAGAWWALRPHRVRVVSADRPNVVLVIGCTVRKDQLTPYGGLPDVTPFLQESAAQGVRFSDAIDAAPWTKVGATAVLTGQHAVSIGMVEPTAALNRRVLAPEVTTVAEHLKGVGYATYGLTANPNINALFGFDQGFDGYYEASGTWASGDMVKVSGAELVHEALSMVAAAPDGAPIYLQLVTLDAHAPYGKVDDVSRWAPDGVPERIARYRAALHRFDDALATLHTGLAHLGLTDANTVFVVVNDHGEGLKWPLHHGAAHGKYLYESTVGMPWIVRGAGVAQGHVVDGLASQVDVLPTLLGLLGLPGYDGPGMDWSAQVRGESARTTREKAYVDTWFKKQERSAVYTNDVACHQDFAHMPERNVLRVYPACYDRKSDPRAERPLEPTDTALLADVDAWHAARVAEYDAFSARSDANVVGGVRAQLEALGYTGDDEEE